MRSSMLRHALVAIAGASALAACTTSSTEGPSGAGGAAAAHVAPKPLPPLGPVALTTDKTLRHTASIAATPRNPQIPDELTAMVSAGWGAIDEGPGQEVVPVTLDGAAPPAKGAAPKRLARFVHLSDTQLADDESPVRLAAVDIPGTITGAFRAHESHECRILNAAVRTINALHEKEAIDFVLLGGDNVDNAQSNEADWFRAILTGAPSVECDSGNDDDPVPGPDNDPKDPFVAEGLKVPWRWVTGNHDVLVQGNVAVADLNTAASVGAWSANGARDWTQPGAPVVRGDVVADARRKLMKRADLMAKIAGDGDGHGVGDAQKARGKAYYAYDVPGSPVRIAVVDSAAETGADSGVIHQADVDAVLKPMLDEAKAAGKIVIVASHHSSQTLTDGSGIGGTKQADALTQDAWRSFLGGYDNVVMHLAGHTHQHRYFEIEPPGGHAYYELETAALADWPHQMNVIEVWDEDDGFYAIRVVPLDYSVEGDPIASDGRTLSVVDLTSGYGSDGSGDPKKRAVELWIAKPSK
jgi:3',5'-cyclic AMP phosphodiesterase CpdA